MLIVAVEADAPPAKELRFDVDFDADDADDDTTRVLSSRNPNGCLRPPPTPTPTLTLRCWKFKDDMIGWCDADLLSLEFYAHVPTFTFAFGSYIIIVMVYRSGSGSGIGVGEGREQAAHHHAWLGRGT